MVQGVAFPGCTVTLVAADSIGLAVPPWPSTMGSRIQNFSLSEAGTTGAKYVNDNWKCYGGTTWWEQRALTGN